MKQINTPQEFRRVVLDILDEQEGNFTGSLEEYLRSLWTLINKHKDVETSHTLLVDILRKAFLVEPPEFDSQWLKYEQPLSWSYRDGTYVIDKLENHKVKIIEQNIDEFRIVKHTILFQIADLYRMRDNQLKDKNRYLGIDSPTGNRWYNFDIFTYLRCATSMMESSARETDVEFEGCDWAELAGLLELGRLYE